MTKSLAYSKQVDLLLTVLGDVMKSPDIALKGGTAINLFLLNLPRLSVDIDLTYLPIESREDSMRAIALIFKEIAERLSAYPSVAIAMSYITDGQPKQLLIRRENVTVKVELNPVLRGTVFYSITMPSCPRVKELYGKELTIQCVSHEDLYAGKFCAALDRQHPRDLFDVHSFFKTFDFSEKLKNAFIIYLLSTNRPIHEVLQPTLLDQRQLYDQEFESMTEVRITYAQLEQARLRLIETIDRMLTANDREFLISFESGKPKWSLLPIAHAQTLPAVKWKQYNIAQMKPEKRKLSVQELKRKLETKLIV